MSGGYFNYKQYEMNYIADQIEQLILNNEKEFDEWGNKNYPWKPETIIEFKKAIRFLQVASIYAQRIDWLASGDDGEDSFHSRLKKELAEVGVHFE